GRGAGAGAQHRRRARRDRAARGGRARLVADRLRLHRGASAGRSRRSRHGPLGGDRDDPGDYGLAALAGGMLIDVAGARLFVASHGAGRPVLLINGLGGSHAMWEPLLGRVPGPHFIAVDAPGTGLSPAPAVPTSIPGFVAMLVELLDQLGLGTVDVLGYSFGGSVAQELARRAPERVRRLVLVAATCGWGGVPGTPAAVAALLTPLR